MEGIFLITDSGPAYLLASASLEGRIEWDPALLEEVDGRIRYLLPPSEILR